MAATIACGNRESFLIETHYLSLIVRLYGDSSELSQTTTQSYTMDTILPDLGTAEQGGLRSSQKHPTSPQLCLPLAATIACGNQESFSIKTQHLSWIVRFYADSSKLSYTTTLYYTADTILPDQGTAEQAGTFCVPFLVCFLSTFFQ